MKSKDRKRKRHHGVLGIIFLVASVLIGMTALVLTGGGIFFVVDQVSFVSSVIGTSLVYNGALIVTIASGLTIAVSFLSYCSWRSRPPRILTIILISLLMVIAILNWSGATLAMVYKSWVSDQIRTYMQSTLKVHYGLNSSYGQMITESWDFAQQKWYCCAVEDNSWGIYRSAEWYTFQPGIPEATKLLVPLSCCRKNQYGNFINAEKCQIYQLGPPGRQSGEYNEAIFYNGCFEASKRSVDFVADAVIINGVVMYFFLICFLVLTCFLHRNLSQSS